MKTSHTLSAFVLVTLALAAACGSRPSDPGRLENVGGSSGEGPDAAASAGTSGGGAGPVSDAGAHDPERPDAGDDGGTANHDAGGASDAGADPDAAAPGSEDGCVMDSLESECGNGRGCPDLDDAADRLLADDPAVVVRRTCEGSDGTRYITIGGSFDDSSSGYIYDAESSELVSMYGVSDVAEFCTESTPSTVGFYGPVINDCASVNPNDVSTPCPDGSSGSGNGDEYPEECVYSDD